MAPEPAATTMWDPLSDLERSRFHRDGYVVLGNVVPQRQRCRLEAAIDRCYRATAKQGHLRPGGQLHARAAVASDVEFARLLDHGPVFRWLWGLLGWNIYSHHSHLDVNPTVTGDTKPERWAWHQDGWRQNSDPEVSPTLCPTAGARPQFSIKAAFVFSDQTEPGRGATLFLPGSHLSNVLPQPADPADYEHPDGYVELRAAPGDVLLFDRRLWHSRSRNTSPVTRKTLFIGYTHRWIRPLDEVDVDERSALVSALSPIQRQLIGMAPNQSDYWGIHESGGINPDIPLRRALETRGLLDRSLPWLR